MTAAAHLPPEPRWPLPIQGLAHLASRRRMMQSLSKRYGSAVVYRRIYNGDEERTEDLQSATSR